MNKRPRFSTGKPATAKPRPDLPPVQVVPLQHWAKDELDRLAERIGIPPVRLAQFVLEATLAYERAVYRGDIK